MVLDAGMIFDRNHEIISQEMGMPESIGNFTEQFINPVYDVDYQDGDKIQSAFWKALCDYQREGFIQGFNSAVQLLMNSMTKNTAKG